MSRSVPSAARRVVFLLLPGVHLLDLGGPAQAFHSANDAGGRYELVFSAFAGTVMTAQGAGLVPLVPPPEVGEPDFVFVPGTRCNGRLPERPLLAAEGVEWLRRAREAGALVASTCTGAVALGEAGLLAGRRATTHWSILDLLQARHPDAQLVDDVLFVHDRGVVTSAGVTSGIDLALSLVEADLGPAGAAHVARDLVVPLRRGGPGGQRALYLGGRDPLDPGARRVRDWLRGHPAERVRLPDLAALAGRSVSALVRAFKDDFGLTPLQYQQHLRLELAARLLREHRLPLEEVARRCGFEDPRHFRRLWKANFGAPPSALRTSGPHRPPPGGRDPLGESR
ncbi:GlxA family transcriptional regulator [Deinococcus apachensis]|uniref:GlxA family transcriptional regulator n=1 Tax=Deinococcus apachensis TaxID=309886 RepID=UPI00036E9AE7|nr:helix-turn-helix domain-containing protein [Deinococcus apachensis]